MYPSVRAAWRPWNTPFEGVVSWLYLDTHVPPLVTTGMGNLVDPIELALGLPWQVGAGGPLAPQDQIRAEWQAVKGNTHLSRAGARADEAVTKLRLSDAAIDALIGTRLDENEVTLKKHPAFADFDNWPADAQLGLMSMCWAMGASFGAKWPHFSSLVAVRDFARAATGCAMEGSPAPARRNVATAAAFECAAQVIAAGADPSVLLSPVLVAVGA